MKTLRETLESVANQNHSDIEHLVVDGGSTDGSLKILEDFPSISWTSGPDDGHYHAMNKGIVQATGEVVAVLNADDCYATGALAAVSRAFESNPTWDALIGGIIYVDGEGQEIFRRREAVWDPQVVRFGFALNHQILFVRKSVYERLGTYRYREFKNACDYDFYMRLATRGAIVGTLQTYLVRYRFHAFGQSADRRVATNMDRECREIRRQYGVPGGFLGGLLRIYARVKRQVQKLIILRTIDWIPGRVYLRRHMRDRTSFSSNVGVDHLEP